MLSSVLSDWRACGIEGKEEAQNITVVLCPSSDYLLDWLVLILPVNGVLCSSMIENCPTRVFCTVGFHSATTSASVR